MPFGTKCVQDLTEADLTSLISRQIAEDKVIDYKRDAIGKTDSDKKEFLYDVSSFANASGGYIIIGMEEEHGVPKGLMGLAATDPDKEILRLEEIIRDGIRPRLHGVQCKAIPIEGGRITIAMCIPKSWNPPHQVVFQKAFRIYGRSSNGKYLLDVDELRSIFSLSENVSDKLRRFRASRISRIAAGETPVNLPEGAIEIIHIVPLSAFSTAASVDFSKVVQDRSHFITATGYGGSMRHNIDGLLAYALQGDGPAESYTQLYRSGIVEIVSHIGEWKPRGMLVLPSLSFEKGVITKAGGGIEILKRVAVSPPVIIMLTLVGIKGWRMGVESAVRDLHPFDRDPLLIPELMIESFDQDPPSMLKPILDAAWNASGFERSPLFDGDGRWTGRQR
jgi:hypothetical protein